MGLLRRMIVVGLVVATLSTCGSDAKSTVASPGSSASPASPTSSVSGSLSAAAGGQTGIVAGEPFTAGVQLVQWETTEKVWRMHFLLGGHTCSDGLASLRPAVGIDFNTGAEDKVPAVGTTTTGVGVAFIPKDRHDIGVFTVNSGITLELDKVDAKPGGHWTGHLKVDQYQDGSDTYSYDAPIDALVCQPGAL